MKKIAVLIKRIAFWITGRISDIVRRAITSLVSFAVMIVWIFVGICRAVIVIVKQAAMLTGSFTRTAVRMAAGIRFPSIIKRSITLGFIVAVCIIGFLSIRGEMPFIAIYGVSMEPELHAGDLIIIEDIAVSDIEEGDIIVFTIPQSVRDFYNYPQVVAHRVLQVNESEYGVTFRTKGDNTGEDPFTVRPQDIKGHISKHIQYLGYPLLFFQSQQGVIFISIALCLLALYLYSSELTRGRQMIHRSIFSPVIRENEAATQALEQRMESTEKGFVNMENAMLNFASAISEYAEHLKSHTGAIQGLSEASQELKKGAAEQNRVLARLLETMEQKTITPETAEIKPVAEPETEGKFPPGCIRNRRMTDKKENDTGAG
jgi:signal peptidase I